MAVLACKEHQKGKGHCYALNKNETPAIVKCRSNAWRIRLCPALAERY
ncbi:MAG: hypothetical protein K0R82_887 [Flavipsychrobacter sp.]|jgi:hypothetical protein|nr:hypothetical protein [Flavipsychrobacter sp.]